MGPFHLSYSVDYSYDFNPLPDPDVGLSILVCDVEHTCTYFHFGMCGRKVVLCLVGQCPGLCTIYVIAGSTQELYTCLFRQMARLLLKIPRCLGSLIEIGIIIGDQICRHRSSNKQSKQGHLPTP